MTQAYIIIDMQNDFIDGALGNAQAQAIVPKVEAKIVASKKDEDQETDLIFTQDTHGEDYSETQEGRKLPIPHCIKDTRGWRICKQLLPYTMWATILEKPSFGCPALVDEVRDYDRLVLMGLLDEHLRHRQCHDAQILLSGKRNHRRQHLLCRLDTRKPRKSITGHESLPNRYSMKKGLSHVRQALFYYPLIIPVISALVWLLLIFFS